MIECIFNTICHIVLNTVKYGLYIFMVVRIDLISTSCKSFFLTQGEMKSQQVNLGLVFLSFRPQRQDVYRIFIQQFSLSNLLSRLTGYIMLFLYLNDWIEKYEPTQTSLQKCLIICQHPDLALLCKLILLRSDKVVSHMKGQIISTYILHTALIQRK